MKPTSIKRLDQDFTLTVDIKIARQFKIRLALARSLIVLAARILGCGLKVDVCR